MKTVIHEIAEEFEKNGISYCHFKSNQHLKESFEGLTDFDILMDPVGRERAISILSMHGGKRFESPCINNYPGIENWLIFDFMSGIIYHLHLHFRLLTGTKHVKQYHIWWDRELLNRAIYNTEYGIRTSSPETELTLLLTRICLKARCKDMLKARVNHYKVSNDMMLELKYLATRVDFRMFEEFVYSVYSEDICRLMIECVKECKLDAKRFLKLRHHLLKSYRNRKMSGGIGVFFQTTYQRIVHNCCKELRRRNHFCVSKKVSERGGISIAFVGTDGSGKSTTAKKIAEWLSPKIECQTLYLGSGDGVKNIRLKFRKKIQSYGKKTKSKSTSDATMMKNDLSATAQMKNEKKSKKNLFVYLKNLYRAKTFVIVSSINRKNLLKMERYTLSGGICVMDRYPQTEFPDDNDGVKVQTFMEKMPSSAAIRKYAKKELENFEIVKQIKPDVIFRLNISLDTCMERKAEHTDREYYGKKIREISDLTFQGARIIDIDAQQPYEEELLEIKRAIWSLI